MLCDKLVKKVVDILRRYCYNKSVNKNKTTTRRKDGGKVRTKMNIEKYNYLDTDCGRNGKAFERLCKETLHMQSKVAAPGRTDMRRAAQCYEIKSGAGELGKLGDKLVKGSRYVIYCPVINPNKGLKEQRAYVMSRSTFIEVLSEAGLLREKTSTNGERKITIQTFWNGKLNAPHGTKYFKLLDALNACVKCGQAMNFSEWLENGWTL